MSTTEQYWRMAYRQQAKGAGAIFPPLSEREQALCEAIDMQLRQVFGRLSRIEGTGTTVLDGER